MNARPCHRRAGTVRAAPGADRRALSWGAGGWLRAPPPPAAPPPAPPPRAGAQTPSPFRDRGLGPRRGRRGEGAGAPPGGTPPSSPPPAARTTGGEPEKRPQSGGAADGDRREREEP